MYAHTHCRRNFSSWRLSYKLAMFNRRGIVGSNVTIAAFVFSAWRVSTRFEGAVRRSKDFERERRGKRLKTLVREWRTFVVFARTTREEIKRRRFVENEVNMMARRQQKLSLKRFFDGWVLRVKEWVKKKAYYDDFVYFYEENAMKSTLKLFSLYSRQRKKIREAKRLLEGILRRRMEHCFGAWSSFAFRIVAAHRKAIIRRILRKWRRAAGNARRILEEALMIQSRRDDRTLRNVLSRWGEVTKNEERALSIIFGVTELCILRAGFGRIRGGANSRGAATVVRVRERIWRKLMLQEGMRKLDRNNVFVRGMAESLHSWYRITLLRGSLDNWTEKVEEIQCLEGLGIVYLGRWRRKISRYVIYYI